MNTTPLDVLPLGLLFVVVCGISYLLLEAGYRLGRWRHARSTEEKETPVGAMVAAILALFAFMLAFAFGMAADRFEKRRQTVLDEANAIGTTYLRAKQLPEPQRGESTRLLREYAYVRIRAISERKVLEAKARSEEIHELLWAQASAAVEKSRDPITGLYIQSLNQMIDLHGVRVHVGMRNRIPMAIWWGLLVLAGMSMASVGYQAGLSATRRSPAMAVLVVAFSSVILLIADLDRPMEGLMVVGQEAMIDLQTSMKTGRP